MRVCLKKKRKNGLFFYYFICFFLFFALLLVFCDTRIRPVIKRKVRDCARTETVYIINRTLLKEIEALGIKYSELAIVSRNSEGEMTSIQTDSFAVNRFKARFALAVTEALKEIEQFDFKIRLGTLLGPEFLTHTGPEIPFKVASSEFVQTEITSDCEESGINQTLHRIYLDVTINICCYFPGYTTSAIVQTELTLGETIIVGTVPSFYAE